MEWKLTLPKPQMRIYYWAKLLGLAPFALKNDKIHPATFPDKLYRITFVAAYILLVLIPFFTSAGLVLEDSSPLTKNTNVLRYILNGAVTYFTLIIFLMMSKEIAHAVNKLCSISEELESLGAEDDLGKLFNRIFVTTVMANLFIGATCLITGLLEPYWPVYVSIVNSVQECVRLNTCLVFAGILFCIGKRFTLLNKKLYDVGKLTEDVGLTDKSKLLAVMEDQSEKYDREYLMRKIEGLHLELCELVDRTTHIFAIPILLNILSFCCEILVSSNWIYNVTLNSTHHEAEQHVWYVSADVLCPLLRMGIVVVEAIIIAHAVATMCQKGNATENVLFRVWNEFTPVKLIDEFFMFSLQLLHKPVTVSAFGFFNLDYSYLFKIFYVTSAYLIIMIQLDTSQPNPGT